MSPKIGLIGRADNRGIGMQTWEFYRHMPVERTLCVMMNEPGWAEDAGRFGTNVTFVDSNLSTRRDQRGLDEKRVREFLDGLDVVFAVETVYDWRFIDWAHDQGVKVVVQGNPEFFVHPHHPFPHPDRWVWPTDWMHDRLAEHLPPEQLGLLPVPCVERSLTAAPYDLDELNVLVVVGRSAHGDRQGTREMVEAISSLREYVNVTITTQDGHLPHQLRYRKNVTVQTQLASVDDRWELYRYQHVLVSPRKYGGLHLPALEAMACGLTVMMPDCSPNDLWPGPRIKARKGTSLRTPFGPTPTFGVHPLDVAAAIDRLAKHREILRDEMESARWYAEQNCWAELGERLYIPLFEEVCS